MEQQQSPHESDSVLVRDGGHLPESISPGVFKESRNILVHSPFLGHVSWLLGPHNEFSEIAISLLGKGSIQ